MKCPRCGSTKTSKAIYYGLPVKLCLESDADDPNGCHYQWGFWSELLSVLPFNGMFMLYRGGYLPALLRWLQ